MLANAAQMQRAAALQVQQLAAGGGGGGSGSGGGGGGGGGGPSHEEGGDNLEAELAREMEGEASASAAAQRRPASPLNPPHMQPLMPIASQQPRAGKEVESRVENSP